MRSAAVRRSEYTPWNFVFPDPEKRIELIRSVYGVTVQPDPYSSYVYLLWLEMYGFKAIHTMSVVDELMEKEAPDPAVMNEEAAAAFAQMQQAYAELSTACQAAALGLVEKPQLSTDSSRRRTRSHPSSRRRSKRLRNCTAMNCRVCRCPTHGGRIPISTM